jgi:hypothetical protein
MHSINRNAAAEARGVPETDQLGGKVNRENSFASRPVQGQPGGRRIEREIVSRHAAIGMKWVDCRGVRRAQVCGRLSLISLKSDCNRRSPRRTRACCSLGQHRAAFIATNEVIAD